MIDDLSPRRVAIARVARRFCSRDDGAVTVDWVVLTAAVVLLGVASGFIVSSAVPDLANKINDVLRAQTVVPD